MVIGRGLLAKTFSEYKASKEVLIFASGVSNSKETNPEAFKREYNLLKTTIKAHPNAKLVYFSTVSITDVSVNSSAYVQHKIQLENYIKSQTIKYLILRVSNVVGVNGNPNTIMNFLVNAVKHQHPITIWEKAERNIIDVQDVFFVVDKLLAKNKSNVTVNIAVRKSVLVQDILKQIETYLKKSTQVTSLDKGSDLPIDVSEISEELAAIELRFGEGKEYINQLLKKYY